MIRRRGERGTAAVETAIVLSMLLLIAIGGFEWGMALMDYNTITTSSREGARIGAAAGDESTADCLILEGAAGALLAITDDRIVTIRIYESSSTGTVGASQVYRPALPTDDPYSLNCGTWYRLQNAWPASSRDNVGTDRDWLGVEVEFDHDWQTGFMWFSGSVCDRGTAIGVDCWTAETVMRIEPAPNN
jgi:hypothetical protein